MAEDTSARGLLRRESVRIGSYRLPLPRSRLLRIVIGSLLVILGLLGFLPVLGFWMVPVGLLILSVDIPRVRRWRRRAAVWFSRRHPQTAARLRIRPNNNTNYKDDSAGRPAGR